MEGMGRRFILLDSGLRGFVVVFFEVRGSNLSFFTGEPKVMKSLTLKQEKVDLERVTLELVKKT